MGADIFQDIDSDRIGFDVNENVVHRKAGVNRWLSPVSLTAAEIASPTAAILADTSAFYILNVAPYSRYVSDGSSLQVLPVGASGNMTSTAVAALGNVSAVLDALSTADTLIVNDVSDTTESGAGTLKELTLAVLAGFWNLPITPQMFGAKGDYVPSAGTGTNDRVALQAFFDYMTSNGGWGFLGGRKYRWDVSGGVGIVIGSTPNSPTSPPCRITGSGMSLDNTTGCSITLIGTCTNAIKINDSIYRGLFVGGFAVLCKTLIGDPVYPVATTEAAIPVTNGLCFDNTYFTSLEFHDLRIDNVNRGIVFLGTTYSGNGEFTRFTKVYAGTTRFFFMATGTGQSYNQILHSCGFGNGSNSQYVASGCIAFELGGGGGGFGISVYDFNSSPDNSDASTAGKTIETLPRITLVKNNGSGTMHFIGGRCEHYSTIYWNADGRFTSQVVIQNMDFAGTYSGTANPTILAETDKKGTVTIRNCAGIAANGSADSRYTDAFVNITLAGSKQNTVIDSCHLGGWGQTVAAIRRTKITYGTHFQSRLELRNCIYDETSSTDGDSSMLINAVYTGSIANHGQMPSVTP